MTVKSYLFSLFMVAVLWWCALLLVQPADAKTFTFEAVVTRVLDGDTVKVRIEGWPEAVQDQLIRLDGIDTAETGKKAKCSVERTKAAAAKAFVQKWLPIGSKIVIVYNTARKDKYNGRILSDVYYKRKSLTAALKAAGHAKPYDGGKKSSWCD